MHYLDECTDCASAPEAQSDSTKALVAYSLSLRLSMVLFSSTAQSKMPDGRQLVREEESDATRVQLYAGNLLIVRLVRLNQTENFIVFIR